MLTYSRIVEDIKKCEGRIITLLVDNNIINNKFIDILTEYLSLEYKIEHNQLLNVQEIKEKTIAFFNFDKNLDFIKMMGNNNVIMIIIRQDRVTHNMDLYGSKAYLADIILIMINEKLKFLKNRYSESKLDGHLNINQLIIDINVKLRGIKLKEINRLNLFDAQ